MSQVSWVHGKYSVLIITDDGGGEVLPANVTDCPACPGLTEFPRCGVSSAKARKSQADWDGGSLSGREGPRLITEPGGGLEAAGGPRSL